MNTLNRKKLLASISFLRKNSAGFTLIELLVVIAIISVLSGVVLQSLTGARKKTNDTARKTQLLEVNKAITRYFTENGSYPSTGGAWLSSEQGDIIPYNADWVPNIVTAKLIPSLPKDPRGGASPDCTTGGWYRAYLYRSDGLHYKLLSHCSLEQDSYPAVNTQFYDPNRPTWALQLTDNYTATTVW